MDAPPDKEPLNDFIDINSALIRQGVHAPQIIEQNTEQGFLLIEDLGSQTYLAALNEDRNRAHGLYQQAIISLLKCQTGIIDQPNFKIADYSAKRLEQELSLFDQWYLHHHLNHTLSQSQQDVWRTTKQNLTQICLEQPKVWVHRDYHSRNLMVSPCDDLSPKNNACEPGVIDFQDMVVGPLSYDLASIFKDCYIRWPRAQQLIWLEDYRDKANEQLGLSIDKSQLVRWYDLTGLQRHLKVLGIFCRLYYRDRKANYMNDLPMVADYVLEVLALYPELLDFNKQFADLISKAIK